MTESNSSRKSTLVTVAGAGLSATGLAHFVAPDMFRGITAPAFPNNTDQMLKVNGGIETVVGALIAVPRTRKAGLIGLGLYGAHLAGNMAKAQLG
ncbi:hypothetical protein [Gordonia phthalatica]|uniref:Membrane protein n=1 Tax=Gordonia phthalatica TaxID=1136941 RepID=A0A0N9N8L1_9ACTN|nr:hypothetical protein [Gordonia phthalatica]ALG83266.1 membrane protein [Gordonia phthalatica]